MKVNKSKSLCFIKSKDEENSQTADTHKQSLPQHQKVAQIPLKNPELLEADLRRTLTKCLKVPMQIEVFYWLYALHSICTAFETVVRIPLDLVLSILNVLRPICGITRMKHTSLFACLILLGSYIITQDFYFLDVSVLYHSFRGQSYVKLYGAGLALQISQKLFTMAGRFLLGKLSRVLRDTSNSSMTMGIQILVCLIYCLSHFMSLYLDFILYTIILNSSSQNVLMFYFVVNLAKMKTSILKKFEKKAFKGTLIFDAKDRFLKLTYSALFLLTINQSLNLETISRIAIVTVFCSIIDYLRHMATLTMASSQEYIQTIQQMLTGQLFWLQPESSSSQQSIVQIQEEVVIRSSEWDFTVIPYVLLLLKFFNIIVWTNDKGKFFNELILQTYIALFLVVYLVRPILYRIVKQLNPVPTPPAPLAPVPVASKASDQKQGEN